MKSEEIGKKDEQNEKNNYHIYALTTSKKSIIVYDILNNITEAQSYRAPKVRDFNTAVVNNEIYVIGGRDNDLVDLKTVYKFNPQIGFWSQTTPMNFERQFPGATAHKDKIFVTGGFPSYKKFECYHSMNRSWEILPEMLTKRYGHSSLYHKDYIYVFGGYTTDNTNTVEKYEIAKRKWLQSTPMLSKRYAFGAAVLNQKIYAVGGFDGDKLLNTGEVYDSEKDSWTAIASMNETRSEFALVAYNNKLYAIGGYARKTVEVYDPTKNVWQFMDSGEVILTGNLVGALIKIN